MSTTPNITWHEDDLRTMSKDDPSFYTWGSHTPICTVDHNGVSITVACDGEMRVSKDGSIARYADALTYIGLNTDADIVRSQQSDDYEWLNNSWFDLYNAEDDFDGHLDCVCHSLTDAIEQAVVLCNEGISQR